MADDDLYIRYMKAFEASTTHQGGCTACQHDQRCETGAPIHEKFARLQDAYENRQRAKKGR